jgi:hypothetical protein
MSAAVASPYRTSNYHSAFRAFEPEQRWGGDRQPCPLQAQADNLLTSVSSRSAFQSCKAENGSEGLPKFGLTGGGGELVTSDKAATIGQSTAAIKGMNADGDQINQMLDMSPTPELFSALKDHSEQQAMDFAVRNPEFQRQALHDMDDVAFQQNMRVRLTGFESSS